MTTIVFNLLVDEPVAVGDLLPGHECILVGPLKPFEYDLTMPKIQVLLRDLLQQAKDSPMFEITHDVLVVCRPTIQSFALSWGIKAAFPRVKVWFVRHVKGVYMDISEFETEGHDFAMSLAEEKKQEILEGGGFRGPINYVSSTIVVQDLFAGFSNQKEIK